MSLPRQKKDGRGYTATDGLKDIWGTKGYIIILDYDGDKTIADPEHPDAGISATALVYSAGRDGDYSTWGDNIKSWGP